MWKKIALCTVGLLAAPVSAQNLVDNGGFEEFVFGIPVNWENFTTPGFYITEEIDGATGEVDLLPYEGEYMAKIFSPGGGACSFAAGVVQQGAPDVTEIIPATAGTTYEFSVRAYERAEDALTAAASTCVPTLPRTYGNFNVAFYDSNGLQLNQGAGHEVNILPGAALEQWTLFSFQATAPANTARAVVSLVMLQPDGNGSGALFFDNVVMEEADPVAPPCPADFNNDGQRTVQDLLAFLSAFRTGCPE